VCNIGSTAPSNNSTLKVLLLTDADVFAGTERHMLDLARGLRDIGVDVTIACPSPAVLEDQARSEGIRVLTIQKKGLFNTDGANMLARMLKSGEIDIVHSHNGRSWLTAAIAVSRAKRGHCIATQHFIEPNHATQTGVKAAISKIAHHWVVKQTSQIVAISNAVKQAMLDRHEASDSKIAVVPNGITPPQVDEAAIQNVRHELGRNADTQLIVCAARLELEKDITTLITAMGQVVKTHPNVLCVVAGEGALLPVLNDQIEQMNLEKSVRLLGFRSDAHALIAASDLFALPSLAEPFGLVLLEAMALSKPIVATRTGGPLEIVEDGKTGILVPPQNPDAMAPALSSLLSNPQLSSEMGSLGNARFLDHFTVKRMAQDMHNIYCRADGALRDVFTQA